MKPINRLLSISSVPLSSAIKSLFIFRTIYSPRRLWNYLVVIVSMHLSKILRRPIVWGYPPILMVEPTNICNLKCPMCPSGNGDMKRQKGQLDLDSFKGLMDDVGAYIYQVQFWNQGEPFINKNILEFIKYAKSKGVVTQTSTNGHFIRDVAAAEALVSSGLDQIIFSMDGTNEESYEKYRVGGDFNLVLDTLGRILEAKRKLKSRTPLIQLQFLVFKHNQDEIEQLIELAKKHRINRISFKSAQVYSRDQAQEFLPDDPEFLRYENQSDELVLKGGLPNWCSRLWLNSTINWDGSVSPCCFDKDAEFAFGNCFASDNSFKQIWKNDKYQNFRKQVLRDRKNIPICCNCNEGLPQPFAKILELPDADPS